MPRSKDVKPFFQVRGEFVDSLDAFMSRYLVLRQAVDSILTLGVLDKQPGVKQILERAAADIDAVSLTKG